MGFADGLKAVLEEMKSISAKQGMPLTFNMPLFESEKDILITTEMLHNKTQTEEISVISALQEVFRTYDEKTIEKICLVKVLDRLDNLASIDVFDKDKQKRIKKN